MSRNSRHEPLDPEAPKPHSDLIIRQRTEAMLLYLYTCLQHFPKAERPGLGADLRATATELLRLIIRAQKRHHKKTTLEDMDVALDLLRSQVRLAHQRGLLPLRRYEHWAKLNDEIGRLLGGWLLSLNGRPAARAAR
jgi:hypothetical protein